MYKDKNKQKLQEKKYYAKNKKHILKRNKEYAQTKKGKEVQSEAYKKWKIKNPYYMKRWQQTKKGKRANKKACKKYLQTEKGRLAHKKKQTKRSRKLNWILLFENPFSETTLVDYHHITDVYVVALPRNLHKLYYGKYHREKTMEIVKQLYLGDDIK